MEGVKILKVQRRRTLRRRGRGTTTQWQQRTGEALLGPPCVVEPVVFI